MRPSPPPVFPRLLALLFAAVPLAAFGQVKSTAPDAPGWGSTWQEPPNEQVRQRQEFRRQCEVSAQAGKYLAIVTLCNRQLQKDPDEIGAYGERALANAKLKRFDQALADVDLARAIAQKKARPNANVWIFEIRGVVDETRKDYAAAVSDLQAARKLDPNNATACNSLAWLRATAPDSAFRDGREGVRLAQKALALEPAGKRYTVTDTLAAAYAEANDYPQAVANEQRAMDDAKKEIKDAAQAQKFQQRAAERLRLFEQHQPYHADLP